MNASEIRSLLSDSPEFETALEALLEIDRERETWTFDDIPLDSGTFGELVGQGVVEKVDGEYRLADPGAVERALGGEAIEADDSSGVEFSMPEIDWTAAGLLAAIVVVGVAVRIANYPAVFRDRVVFTGNDPYYYVYAVEEGLRNGWSFSELPAGLATGEPLTIVQLLYAAEFAGGLGSHTAILAWMPVLVGVATVVVLYLFAFDLTNDRRIALASAFGLAVIPVHVSRSSLGFVDHHVFDYFWIVVAAWGLTLTVGLDDREIGAETIKGIGLLGIGVAGQVLAWQAGALLIAPIGLAVVLGGFVAVREDRPFLGPGLATAAGVGIGTLLVGLAHVTWGWHDGLAVAIPVALFVGAVAIVGMTQLCRRLTLPAWAVPVTSVGIAGAATLVVYLGRPEWWATIQRELQRLAGIGFEDTAEAQSLFSSSTMGWLFFFGFILLIAIPYMAWGVYAVAQGRQRWIGVTAYAWFTLVLAVSLARFAGELSPFIAIFTGLGLLHVAAWIDAVEPPVPFGGSSRRLTMPETGNVLRVAVVVGLIFGLSIAMAPVSASNFGFGDDQYETATFMDRHAEANGYEYPESYVFSQWSWNRMYNYHVSGEAGSYGPARNHYFPFASATDPAAAMERVERVPGDGKYVVTAPIPGASDSDIPPESMQSRLHDRLGNRGDGVGGLGHYRALYVSDGGSYKVFRFVPGATIRGNVSADEVIYVSTPVEIDGASFTYERQVQAGEDGGFSVTVPYPGEYTIETETQGETAVTIEESAVAGGEEIRAES